MKIVSGNSSTQISLSLPLLLSCPHGGESTLDQILLRHDYNYPSSCCEKFVIKSDLHTIELTDSIADNIRSLSEREVYRKIAQIDRSYIDFNRDPECAIEPSNEKTAEKKYHDYHKEILKTIKEMCTQNEKGLQFLFDIHGTGLTEVKDSKGQSHPIDIIIGTDEGRSIHALTEHDPPAWWGPKGLIRLLQNKNIRVWPQDPTQESQSHIMDGGFTIKTFGSSQFNEGLVAIQCEVIHEIRENDQKREQFARDMADCIYTFVRPYFPKI